MHRKLIRKRRERSAIFFGYLGGNFFFIRRINNGHAAALEACTAETRTVNAFGFFENFKKLYELL